MSDPPSPVPPGRAGVPGPPRASGQAGPRGLAASNPRVQRLRRLAARRSTRSAEGAYVIEGLTLVAEALSAGVELEAIYAEDGAADSLGHPAVPVVEVGAGVVTRVASTVTPQPVLAVARAAPARLTELAGATFVVVAAGLADPGNVGTLLRTAEAAGAGGVILTAGSVDVYNPKCVRASAGALFHVPVVTDVDLAPLVTWCRRQGLAIVGTAPTGGTAYDRCDLQRPLALVLGSEAHGLPARLPVDDILTIPHAGRAESLNVAMAAAVVCFEVARQRRVGALA